MTEAPAFGRWEPIKTCPRDGSWFVTVNANSPGEYEVGRYQPHKWRKYEEAGDGLFRAVDTVVSEFTHDNFHRATHWMPFPLPPAPEVTHG